MSSLLVVLQNSLPSPSRSNARHWSLISLGLFSVSSFFYAFSAPSSSPSFTHKTVWTSSISSKVQVFLWKNAWNHAPTLDIIQSFNPNPILLPNVYSLCLNCGNHKPSFYPLPLYLESLETYFPVCRHFLCSSKERLTSSSFGGRYIRASLQGSSGFFCLHALIWPYGSKRIYEFLITLLRTSL